MVYDLARLSFHKLPQQTLEPVHTEPITKPIIVAEKLLQSNKTYLAPRTYQKRGGKRIEHVRRGYVDIVIRSFLIDRNKKVDSGKDDCRLLAFKIGRPSKTKITSCSEDEFEEFEEEDYPNIKVIWIREQQLISIERKPTIFSKPELIINSLEDHLNNLLQKYGLGVSIALLSREAPFWDCIKTYQNRIYEVNFILFAPNFFGNLHTTTKEMLESVRQTYSAEKLKVGIENDQGKLTVMSDDKQTSNYLLWIGEGGGKWSIKVMGNTGKKETIKSSDSTRSVSVEFDEYSIDSALSIIKSILYEIRK